MPYVDGESLRDRLRREAQLPLEEALRIVREVALALDHAHRHGVIHRDIKPENILLSDGQALVADFGVARPLEQGTQERLTETGLMVGTPAYMSPEQASGGMVDARSDIYALACVLYELLAGEPPYTGPTPQSITAKRLVDPVPSVRRVREGVPEGVERAITRAMAKVPADRFATASQFAANLNEGAKSQSSPPRQFPRAHTRALVAVATLVLAVMAGIYLWQRFAAARAVQATDVASAGVAFSAPSGPSIAVLPFANLSSDRENEYFSDGITEELINGLANVAGLSVAARTSSFSFKGKNADVREIGARLGVRHVLEGSVRKSGDRIRITAQLINTSDGYHLWSRTFDRKVQDVFVVQDELARAIVSSLQLQLMGDSVIIKTATADPEAHDLYLKGRYFWNRPLDANLRKAINFFERALERDSTYALAYSGLADAYFLLGAHGYVPPKEVLPRAKAAALKAIVLDSTLAEAHISLASVARWWDWNPAFAERHFQRAIALNPRYPEAYRLHAWLLVDQVDTAGAIREMRRAQTLDPLSPLISAQLGVMFSFARTYDSALEQGRRTLELDSSWATARGAYRGLSITYMRLGRLDEAFRVMEKLASQSREEQDHSTHLTYLNLYVAAGRLREARNELRAVQEIANRRYIRAGDIAAAYALLGERDSAFAWLERGVRERSLGTQLKVTPAFETLHSDPRWSRILSAMNLD